MLKNIEIRNISVVINLTNMFVYYKIEENLTKLVIIRT